MKIALTKKLANALGGSYPTNDESEDPLFSWTANWTKVWENRRVEDMLVLVNNATRFTVGIYQVKRKDLKDVDKMMKTAISNTLLAMNLNPEMVKKYLDLAGEVEFVRNKNRQRAAWVSKAGENCIFHVGREYNDVAKMFDDTVGAPTNHLIVSSKDDKEGFWPDRAMVQALSDITGKQAYKYRAFELKVTLDLKVYQAVRKIIVPGDIELEKLHKVLQSVFNWRDYHLYDFSIGGSKRKKPRVLLVPFEENLDWGENAVLMKGHVLSEYFPKHKHMYYTYDMGDYWQHDIELVRVIEDYDKESPYLLEASGKAPPEDVGGVGGFVNFREIMMDPDHPEHKETKEWAKYWSLELGDWESRPRVIRYW